MINIVLSGGIGERLWPLSKESLPKQFYPFFENESLFQKTVKRNSFISKTIVILNENQISIAHNQAQVINKDIFAYLGEPFGRNTAPAIAIASFLLSEEEIVLVTPSDHLIIDEEKYQKTIFKAKNLAEKGFLVTFGIKPNRVETGYGYIKADGETVLSFHEKPTFQKALEYINSGKYYWNSGIFCFKVKTFLDELKKYEPELYNSSKYASETLKLDSNRNQILKIEESRMSKVKSISIDYAVMERSDKIKMIQSDFDWSDLGTFESLGEIFEKDNYGNISKKNLIYSESSNNSVFSENRTVILIDLDDLIVVDTSNVLLITKKGSSQKIKTLQKELNEL
ncbi:mannose-1-phosphate guanylyltransferase [bacterium]|nr:mannose-1-phosphate guanylyltransferase [bacterium]